MALESASSVRVLEQFPNLLEEYTEHSKFRLSIKGEKKQRSLIVKHYKDVINLTERQALDYLDYNSDCYWSTLSNMIENLNIFFKNIGYEIVKKGT